MAWAADLAAFSGRQAVSNQHLLRARRRDRSLLSDIFKCMLYPRLTSRTQKANYVDMYLAISARSAAFAF